MTGRSRRQWPAVVWLAAVWTALWGDISLANVLGGLVLAVVLLSLLPLPVDADRARVSPVGLLRFGLAFVVDLVRASAQVVVLVLRPGGPLRQGIVAVEVPGATDRLLTLVADAVSLTPGTLTIEVDQERATLFVHALDVGDGPEGVERVRADILRTAERAGKALGIPIGRAAGPSSDPVAAPRRSP